MPPTSNNQEIDQYIKEYEEKSGESHNIQPIIIPQTSKNPSKQMEGVYFDTDKATTKTHNETSTPKMVQLVVKYSGGIITNQKQAELILLVFALLAIGISIYLMSGLGNKNKAATPAMIEEMKNSGIHK